MSRKTELFVVDDRNDICTLLAERGCPQHLNNLFEDVRKTKQAKMLAFEAPHRRPRIYAALVMYPNQQDPRCIHGEMAFGRCRNRAEVNLVRKAVTEIMKQAIETHRLPVDALWNRETN